MQNQLVRALVSLAVSIAVVWALLFLPAGTFAWPQAWWFIAVFVLGLALSIAVLWRVNPEIFAARTGFKPGTKRWDLVIAPLAIVGLVAILPVAGLDYRFGWTQVPLPFVILGHLLFIAGFIVLAWAQAVNKFFEPGVRIQTERAHQVIDTGPYAYVRHPGYVGASFLAVGMALALGSFAALLPAILTIAVLVLRTALEDRTLQIELPGYADYARRVRYRLVPGLW